jgi:hypothetical protein
MADTALVLGLAGVASGAAIAIAGGFWQWRIAGMHEAAESSRVRDEHANKHLERRQEAYSELIAFLTRSDDTNSGLPVIRVEERDRVFLTIAKVVLLGSSDVREQTQSFLDEVFVDGQISPELSVDEWSDRLEALIDAMRKDADRRPQETEPGPSA